MSLELTLWINQKREAVCRNYRSITQLILWVLLLHFGLRADKLKCLLCSCSTKKWVRTVDIIKNTGCNNDRNVESFRVITLLELTQTKDRCTKTFVMLETHRTHQLPHYWSYYKGSSYSEWTVSEESSEMESNSESLKMTNSKTNKNKAVFQM